MCNHRTFAAIIVGAQWSELPVQCEVLDGANKDTSVSRCDATMTAAQPV